MQFQKDLVASIVYYQVCLVIKNELDIHITNYQLQTISKAMQNLNCDT